MAGLAIVGTVVLLVESGSAAEDSGEPATWASLVKLGIGVLFALLVLEQCRPGSPAEPNGSPAALSRSGGQLGWGTILM